MFVYFIQEVPGKFVLKARSTPLAAKTLRTKTWENVRFLEFAGDIARNYGFTLDSYNITNWLYDRVDQIETADFLFLAERCGLEGYCLKVHNKKIVIYSEPILEQQEPVFSLAPEDFIEEFSFLTVSEGLFSSCLVRYLDSSNKLISHRFAPDNAPVAPELKTSIRAANHGEAQRFAHGLLREKNKWETWADIRIKLNTAIAAGNTIAITGMGVFSGKYFVHSCSHRLSDDRTSLRIRKVLEGY
jgi:hypothetical protein